MKMAFRAGVHSARGAVYSRRRGRGGVRAARMRAAGLIGGPGTIYEETDEETDCPAAVAGNSQPLIRQAKATISRSSSVLKDKANVTRSPRKVTGSLMEHQQDIAEGRRVDAAGQPYDSSIVSAQFPISAITVAPEGIKQRPPVKSTSSIIDDLVSDILGSNVSPSDPLWLTLKTLRVYSDECSSSRNDGESIPKDDQPTLPTEKVKTSSRPKTSQMAISQPSISLTNKTFQTIPFMNAVDNEATIKQESESGTGKRGKKGKNAPKARSSVSAQMLGQRPTEHNTASIDTKENTKVPRQSKLKRPKADKRAKARPKTTSGTTISVDTKSNDNDTVEIGLESALQDFDIDETHDGYPPKMSIDLITEDESRKAGPSTPLDFQSNTPNQDGDPKDTERTPSFPSTETVYDDCDGTPQAFLTRAPPQVRKQFQFWTSSNPIEPVIASPSPSPRTGMNTEDFVMFRRGKESNNTNEKPDTPVAKSRHISRGESDTRNRGVQEVKDMANRGEKEKSRERGLEERGVDEGDLTVRNGTVNRWVRFLDVALTVPSDESDDELNFCKPKRNTNTNYESKQRYCH